MLHYEFIKQTDKRSLMRKIKHLVDVGKESYKKDLEMRSNNVRELIENEEKVLENEFVRKIEQRNELDIRARKNFLLKNKEMLEKELDGFRAKKMVHQIMLTCNDVRDELLRKDNKQTHLIQLYQMEDKMRAQNRQKRDEEFWLKAQNRVNERVDRIKEEEDCLRKSMFANQLRILDMQIEEKKKEEERAFARSKKDREELNRQARESTTKSNKEALETLKAKTREAKLAFLNSSEQKQHRKQEEQNFEDVFYCEMMKQMNEEFDEAKVKSMRLMKETRDYLEYMKKYHEFVDADEKYRNKLEDEGNKRYNCMKYAQRKKFTAGKRQIAEASHRMLLKQICEEQARRMKLEAAEREKMPEYPFPEVRVVDKFKERLIRQKDLADRIEQINRFKEIKQKEFEMELKRAEEDKIICMEVLKKHNLTGLDYLPPHPNWKLVRCGYNPELDKSKEVEDRPVSPKKYPPETAVTLTEAKSFGGT